jgi:SecD-like export protein
VVTAWGAGLAAAGPQPGHGRAAVATVRAPGWLAADDKEIWRRVVPRRAALAVIITLGVVAAAVALTGTVIASSGDTHPARFRSPLLVYPVTQANPGQCPAGTPGITGPGAQGQTCYRVAQGIAIRRVTDIHVQRGGAGYDVSMSLLPADSKSFASLTRRMTGGSLALVVRGRVVTAPSVSGPITKGKILITGATRREEADRLVRELKGAAPAPVATTPPPITPTTPGIAPTTPGLGTPGTPLPGGSSLPGLTTKPSQAPTAPGAAPNSASPPGPVP